MAKDRDRGSWPDSRGPHQQPSRPFQQVQAPRAARPSPPAHRSGGPAGNERLTAMTGTVLLILLAVGCPAHDHDRRHGRADRAAGGPTRPTLPRLPPSPRLDGTAPVDMGTGGSIPFIADFQRSSRREHPHHWRRG